MAVTWDQVKTHIPGVGYRAYIWSIYRDMGGAINQCTCEYTNPGMQCMYMMGEGLPQDSWQGGGMGPMNGIFPNIGEWVSVKICTSPTFCYILCHKLLEIIDEATFLTGTCVSCYNNGCGGQCSDAFVTVGVPPPPYGDPLGCFYNNLINPGGIGVVDFGVYGNPTYTYTAWISPNCDDCTSHVPPNFTPNMIVNCCDPSERYQLSPFQYTSVWTLLTGTGPGELGINNSLQAFRADIYIGGASTGYKCWHLEEADPSNLFGAHAITVTLDPPNKFPDCGHLNHHLTNPPYNYPPCCPPEPDGCDSNILATLNTKVSNFQFIKDSIVGP